MKNLRLYSVLTIALGVISSVLLLLFVKKESRNLLAYVSIIGTLASIVGLVLAYMQIISLKKTSNLINEEVQKTIKRVNNIVSVSDLSKSRKQIGEIQVYLQHSNYQGALIRMKDLKDELVSAKFIKGLEEIDGTEDYNNVILTTGIDINILNDCIIKSRSTVNTSLITKNLEKTRELLVEFDNKIKNLSYETN